jgi:hypothetical protein
VTRRSHNQNTQNEKVADLADLKLSIDHIKKLFLNRQRALQVLAQGQQGSRPRLYLDFSLRFLLTI